MDKINLRCFFETKQCLAKLKVEDTLSLNIFVSPLRAPSHFIVLILLIASQSCIRTIMSFRMASAFAVLSVRREHTITATRRALSCRWDIQTVEYPSQGERASLHLRGQHNLKVPTKAAADCVRRPNRTTLPLSSQVLAENPFHRKSTWPLDCVAISSTDDRSSSHARKVEVRSTILYSM